SLDGTGPALAPLPSAGPPLSTHIIDMTTGSSSPWAASPGKGATTVQLPLARVSVWAPMSGPVRQPYSERARAKAARTAASARGSGCRPCSRSRHRPEPSDGSLSISMPSAARTDRTSDTAVSADSAAPENRGGSGSGGAGTHAAPPSHRQDRGAQPRPARTPHAPSNDGAPPPLPPPRHHPPRTYCAAPPTLHGPRPLDRNTEKQQPAQLPARYDGGPYEVGCGRGQRPRMTQTMYAEGAPKVRDTYDPWST